VNWIEQAFWNSWSEETAMGWIEENPGWGHSEVSALVVQDYLGGTLKQGNVVAEGVILDIHCWNDTKYGEIDFTAAPIDIEYGAGNWYLKKVKTIDRDDLMKHSFIKKKYDLLTTRVQGYIVWKAQHEGKEDMTWKS
jgi:hypothetical protein